MTHVVPLVVLLLLIRVVGIGSDGVSDATTTDGGVSIWVDITDISDIGLHCQLSQGFCVELRTQRLEQPVLEHG